jgi:hypothetical protein
MEGGHDGHQNEVTNKLSKHISPECSTLQLMLHLVEVLGMTLAGTWKQNYCKSFKYSVTNK